MRKPRVVRLAMLAGLLAFSGSGWTQSIGERALLRQKTERRIAALEERVAGTQPMDPVAEFHAKVAGRLLEMARTALEVRNERAASVLAEKADRMITLVTSDKGAQR